MQTGENSIIAARILIIVARIHSAIIYSKIQVDDVMVVTKSNSLIPLFELLHLI